MQNQHIDMPITIWYHVYMTYDDDLSPKDYEYLAKYMKRTGIFRMYQMDSSLSKTWLFLEFVIRGKILFRIKVWKYKKSIFNDS